MGFVLLKVVGFWMEMICLGVGYRFDVAFGVEALVLGLGMVR